MSEGLPVDKDQLVEDTSLAVDKLVIIDCRTGHRYQTNMVQQLIVTAVADASEAVKAFPMTKTSQSSHAELLASISAVICRQAV